MSNYKHRKLSVMLRRSDVIVELFNITLESFQSVPFSHYY